jgi:MoaA/NifB/PqqE/SkfB family radical SAM enzyme
VTQAYLLGGEPLLHPELPAFLFAARKHLPHTKLYLLTNGTLVIRQEPAFWQALHETQTILLCDAYPIGLPVEEINALGARFDVKVEWTDARGEFFKIPLDLAGGQDPEDSFKRCSGINNCPMLRDGRLYPCAFTAYADVLRDRFDLDALEVGDRDSISILDDRDPQEVLDFLRRPVPYCRHCDFDHFELYPWGRTERKVEEWT